MNLNFQNQLCHLANSCARDWTARQPHALAYVVERHPSACLRTMGVVELDVRGGRGLGTLDNC